MKNKMKSLVMMLVAVGCVFSLVACGNGEAKKNGSQVSGNTYVFESASVDGEAMDSEMTAFMEGSTYAFKSDGTCVYSVTFMEMTTEVKGTYTQDKEAVTVTLDYGEEGTVDMKFTVSEEAITYSETLPAFDDEGNEIEGQTTTTEQVYKLEK